MRCFGRSLWVRIRIQIEQIGPNRTRSWDTNGIPPRNKIGFLLIVQDRWSSDLFRSILDQSVLSSYLCQHPLLYTLARFSPMDSDQEKATPSRDPISRPDEENVPIRAVAFPDENDVYEDKQLGTIRPKGVEMKRTMTQEDRDLAAAGYEHLEEKAKKGAQAAQFDHVDIQEHRLSISGFAEALQTSIKTKNPADSPGLTSEEAKARLDRYGRNILTPPIKKSALRKVPLVFHNSYPMLISSTVLGLSDDDVQYSSDRFWCARIRIAWDRLQGTKLNALLWQSLIRNQNNFQNTYLGGILIGVAFLNAFIEFYQVQRSGAILESFLAMIPPSCRVVRDSTILSIPAAELVKGDVVLLVRFLRSPLCYQFLNFFHPARRRQDTRRPCHLRCDGSQN